MTESIEIRVRYAETDQMGRAHHSHYLVWCELARTTLLRERGLSYAALEGEGFYLPISRVEVEYRRPVGYDEIVRVETWVERVRSREVSFGYRLTRGDDGALVAAAQTALVATDARGRPTRIPERVRECLEELARAAAAREDGPGEDAPGEGGAGRATRVS